MSEIFRITKDERRAAALKTMAKDRFNSVGELKQPYRLIEEYYEIIKELLTSIMYKSGFKTLSHKALVEFARDNIKNLTSRQLDLIDELRIKRNNIVYYGENVTSEFLKSREKSIKEIIKLLFTS
jgi:hypothetical protein